MSARKRINLELIQCPICAAALMDEEDERSHLQWHEIVGALLAERPHPGVRLEGLADDMLNSQRVKYDADENTPYVDNAGTEKQKAWDSQREKAIKALRWDQEKLKEYLEGSW